jgi:hypothetical protein
MKETRAVLLDLRGTLIDVAGSWKLTDNERARFLRSFDGAIHGADIQRALVEAVADVLPLVGVDGSAGTERSDSLSLE